MVKIEDCWTWFECKAFINGIFYYVWCYLMQMGRNQVKLEVGAKYSFWLGLNVKSSSLMKSNGNTQACPTILCLRSEYLLIFDFFSNYGTSAAVVAVSSGIHPKTYRYIIVLFHHIIDHFYWFMIKDGHN